jgi:hypothetical protein
MVKIKNCKQCNEEFETNNDNKLKIFCSIKCQQSNYYSINNIKLKNYSKINRLNNQERIKREASYINLNEKKSID